MKKLLFALINLGWVAGITSAQTTVTNKNLKL